MSVNRINKLILVIIGLMIISCQEEENPTQNDTSVSHINLKILGYGNSFMRNSIHYLSEIAKGCGVNIIVGNLYTGGTYLEDHYEALLNDTNPYYYHKYENGINTVNDSNLIAMHGLLDEKWDIIILHQYNVQSHSIEPTFSQFVDLIDERLGYCPKIYINSTWAYHNGYINKWLTDYYAGEAEMWEDMLSKWKLACRECGISDSLIIPTGTAIQNARTLSWADGYNRFVNGGATDYSDDWHHLNPAGGFIAACTIFQKIVSPLTGINCSSTNFRITTQTSLPPQVIVQDGVLVTDDNFYPMCKAAISAVENPYEITFLSSK